MSYYILLPTRLTAMRVAAKKKRQDEVEMRDTDNDEIKKLIQRYKKDKEQLAETRKQYSELQMDILKVNGYFGSSRSTIHPDLLMPLAKKTRADMIALRTKVDLYPARGVDELMRLGDQIMSVTNGLSKQKELIERARTTKNTTQVTSNISCAHCYISSKALYVDQSINKIFCGNVCQRDYYTQ